MTLGLISQLHKYMMLRAETNSLLRVVLMGPTALTTREAPPRPLQAEPEALPTRVPALLSRSADLAFGGVFACLRLQSLFVYRSEAPKRPCMPLES